MLKFNYDYNFYTAVNSRDKAKYTELYLCILSLFGLLIRGILSDLRAVSQCSLIVGN